MKGRRATPGAPRGALPRWYWGIVAAAIAVWLLMSIWTVPAISPPGFKPFDFAFPAYDAERAAAYLRALGAEGRARYLGRQIVLDLFYPALLTAVVGIGALRLAPGRAGRWIAGLAILAMVLDYGENGLIVAVLRAGPEAVDALRLRWLGIVTAAKFTTYGVAMLGLLFLMMRRWRQRN
ncbi:MAG: hypothetical protein D6688_12310 [Alphaproteobacteria bacterium]|nr:MAG: hypothetical protein D6688_12310 [Alphaproteobacteria bacterium]